MYFFRCAVCFSILLVDLTCRPCGGVGQSEDSEELSRVLKISTLRPKTALPHQHGQPVHSTTVCASLVLFTLCDCCRLLRAKRFDICIPCRYYFEPAPIERVGHHGGVHAARDKLPLPGARHGLQVPLRTRHLPEEGQSHLTLCLSWSMQCGGTTNILP